MMNLSNNCEAAKIILIKLPKIDFQMQSKDSRRKQRLTNIKKDAQDSVARRSSLSTTKMFSQLSMSFYDESTIRKNKQIIMDNCAFQLKQKQAASQFLNKSKGKLIKSSSKRRKKQIEGVFFEQQKDEMDFRTTQQSKLVTKDEDEKGKKPSSKFSDNKSSNKQKGNSLEKFRKLLLADIIQSRIKTPKLLNKKQTLYCKKH